MAVTLSAPAGAESLTHPPLVFPYKDLPGVQAPHPAADDGLRCHTATGYSHWELGVFHHSLPRLLWRCEKDGIISEGTNPPNRGFWQYTDPKH